MNENNNSTNTSMNTQAVWPGAFGIFSKSRQAVMTNINLIIICYAIIFGTSMVTSMFTNDSNNSLGSLIGYLVGLVISPIMAYALIQGVRGVKVDLSASYDRISPNLLHIVLTQFIVGIITGLTFIIPIAIMIISILAQIGFSGQFGFGNLSQITPMIIIGNLLIGLILLIPFAIVAPKLSLSLMYAVDKDMTFQEALATSWKNTRGHFGKIYGIIGVSMLIGLIAITIIGIPVAIYLGIMYGAAMSILYIFIDNQKYQSINS